MPLPKPPASKAAHVAAADFEAQAAPRAEKRSTRASTDPEIPAALDLFDGGVPVAAQKPSVRNATDPSAKAATALPTKAPISVAMCKKQNST